MSHSQSQGYSEDEAIEILKVIRDRSREVSDIYDAASYYESDPNLYLTKDYEEYLRNSLAEELPPSFTEWIDRYFNLSQYVHEEKSPIIGRTFHLNLYSDDFLKGLFTDIFDTPATEKVNGCMFIRRQRR